MRPSHAGTFHVTARSFQEEMLKPTIRRLNRRYAGGFNWRHSRRGHVFDSPYKSIEIVREAHAYRLPDYIAENPPFRPWPWSSYDTVFAFVQPLPWDETLESGSASPNQVRPQFGG